MALLRSGRWFGGLAPEVQDDLLALAVVKTLAPEETLFLRGAEPDGLYAVVDGSVRICGRTDAGKEVLLTVIDPPGWFGEIAVFDGDVRTHDAIAQVETTVILVPQVPLLAMLAANPPRWRDLAMLLATKLRLVFAMVEDTVALPLKTQLARRVLSLARVHGEWDDRSRRVLSVGQEQLATMLGTSRQTVNAILKDFAAKGLLRASYGRIELLDFEGLRVAAEEATLGG
ncbi:MAG: Crp/Fnr family transcriptional regulator [Labilithrix sp.]|nr:Crp/Fnr family transcriptional regulator [Labilithrix sp.]